MSQPEVRNAKAMCAECPARRACLAYGLDEEWGIWGGYTKPERSRALDSLGSHAAIMAAYDDGDLDEAVSLPR